MTPEEAVDRVLQEESYLRKHFAQGDEGVPGWIAGAAHVYLKHSGSVVVPMLELKAIALKKLAQS